MSTSKRKGRKKRPQPAPHARDGGSSDLAGAGAGAARPASWAWRRTPQKAFTGARRYSYFVRIMKLVLPMIALAIVAAILVFGTGFYGEEEMTVTFSESPSLEDDRSMMRPTFSGTTASGRPFEIAADSAERLEENPDQVRMKGLAGDMVLEDGSKLAMTALGGLLDLENKHETVSGDVQLQWDGGYRFRTDTVFIDLDEQSVRGDDPITGQGPAGDIRAEQFRISPGWETVRFEGGVTMTLLPSGMKRARGAEPAGEMGNNEG